MLVEVIISVYRDAEALSCVLFGLESQDCNNFSVCVAEDGRDPKISDYVSEYPTNKFALRHINQEDDGFRKTMAVNRAIASSLADYLIFLDGDCIPHPMFVSAHLRRSSRGSFLVGRRMHLGNRWSQAIRTNHQITSKLHSWASLLFFAISLHFDRARNFEIGAPSLLMEKLFSRKIINLVGCNFSCFYSDIRLVNGYNENLRGVGAEDDDLEARFKLAGLISVNVKFSAICYHLFHASRRAGVVDNIATSQADMEKNGFYCEKGIDRHMSVTDGML